MCGSKVPSAHVGRTKLETIRLLTLIVDLNPELCLCGSADTKRNHFVPISLPETTVDLFRTCLRKIFYTSVVDLDTHGSASNHK
jgi:hypothetical protein